MSDILIVMPAYNEEKNITGVLRSIKSLNTPADILVVNDGSKDKTREMVTKEGINLIEHPYNLGYGAALQTGFKYAAMNGYRYVIQFDSDGQHSAEDLPVMINELRKGVHDIVIGSRFLGDASSKVGFMKRMAIRFFRYLIRAITDSEITDPTSGLKGLNARAFKYYSMVDNFPQDFPDADVLIKMLYLNYRVGEVPAHIKERGSGKSMHSGLKPVLYIFKMVISIFVVILHGNISKEVTQ